MSYYNIDKNVIVLWILTSFIALRSARLSCKRKSKRNQWTTVCEVDILRKYCLQDLDKSQHKLLFLSFSDFIFNICLPCYSCVTRKITTL